MHYRVGRLRHGDDSATADATGSSRWMAPLPVGTNNKTSYDAWSKVVAGGYDVCSSDAPSTSDVRVSACVDMDKPIVEQIGRLQADTYVEWIRCPNMDTGSVRFFESDILEACSKAYWFMVPLIWIPVAVIAIVSAIYEASPWTFYTHEIDAHIGVAILCTVGYLLWFVLEYCIHRFIFHLSPVTTWGKTMHFIAHGCHHKFPMDRMRLVRYDIKATDREKLEMHSPEPSVFLSCDHSLNDITLLSMASLRANSCVCMCVQISCPCGADTSIPTFILLLRCFLRQLRCHLHSV